jgi:surface polysaccharide O-acyltransferase-like enzyme
MQELERKQKKNISVCLSNKITRIMFVMSIMVVYIHAYDAQYSSTTFHAVRVLEDFLSQGLCRVAVPVFLMISGFLHFSREKLTEESLLQTLPGKIPVLIIPYLLWNTIYMLYDIACAALTGRLEGLVDLGYVLKGVFLYGNNQAFWYVFQLIVLFVLSPFLLKLYKRKFTAAVLLVAFFLMYLLVEKNTKWFLLPGLWFFSVGAVCAIHFPRLVDWDCWRESSKKIVPAVAMITVALLMVYRAWIMDISVSISVLRDTVSYRFFESAIAFAFWYAADIVRIGKYKPLVFEKDSFIIYAAHVLVLSVVCTVVRKVVPITPYSRIVVYLVMPAVVVACILGIAALLKKYVPRFYKVISGGR